MPNREEILSLWNQYRNCTGCLAVMARNNDCSVTDICWVLYDAGLINEHPKTECPDWARKEETKMTKEWTDDEIKKLIEMKMNKVKTKDIAEALGRSESAIGFKYNQITHSKKDEPTKETKLAPAKPELTPVKPETVEPVKPESEKADSFARPINMLSAMKNMDGFVRALTRDNAVITSGSYRQTNDNYDAASVCFSVGDRAYQLRLSTLGTNDWRGE